MNKLGNRLLLATLSAIIFLTASGCWSPVELNDRAFVNLMMVDLTDDGQFELTLGFPLPNRMIPGQAGGSGESSKDPFAFVSKTGKNLPQALQDIQSDLSRRITFGQTRIIVIGSKLAMQGIDPVLDFISRHIAFHISANMFIARGSVMELVKTPTTFERFVSVILRAYINQKLTIDTTLRDILRTRYGSGDILVPILSFGKQPGAIAKKEQAEVWMGVDGAAILKKNKMIRPILNKDEMRAALMIDSDIKEMAVSIESPIDGKDITFNVEHVRTKIQASNKKNVPGIRLLTRGTASVLSSDSKLDLQNDTHLIMAQKALNEELSRRIMQMINTTREAKADVFQFKNYLNWKYPDVWQRIQPNWNEYYAEELVIEPVTHLRLRGTGEAYRSIRTEWGEST